MKLSLSQNISSYRKANSMTQEQLAEALGITFASVSKWERGVAVPDLHYIAEMADLFGVSMDAMVGYQVQDGSCKALEERIKTLQRAKQYDEAAAEAEKALIRYPNSFPIVYACGEMFHLKGLETNSDKDIERSIDLMNRALLLLPQNTDPKRGEFTICAIIAQGYLCLGKRKEGVELMKKNNWGGVLSSFIGMTCAAFDDFQPEEAVPYLSEAFLDSITVVVRTVTGYGNYYARIGNYEAALDACLWVIRFMESIKEKEDSVTFVDKLRASFYAECAHLCDRLGRTDETEPLLRKALSIARSFDAAPTSKVDGLRFCLKTDEKATVYDDIGESAMAAIEAEQLQREGWSKSLFDLWQKLKKEAENNEKEN